MTEGNKIGIVGTIQETPRLILDAPEFERKIYETKIAAPRRSGTEDILILRYSGKAAGKKKDAERLKKGTRVIVAGEIRTENEREIVPTQPSVKIFIFADGIAEATEHTESQNEVRLCGHICKDPRARAIRNKKTREEDKEPLHITDLMVAVEGSGRNPNYIPCICWQNVADAAADLKKGMYVEIEGRFQSREYQKTIEEGGVPFLMTAYEVSVVQMGVDYGNEEIPEGAEPVEE